MILFTLFAAIGYVLSLAGTPAFAISYLLFSLLLMFFAVIATNFTAISLEPMGHLAGTATAVTGFVSTTGGARSAVPSASSSTARCSRSSAATPYSAC